MNEPIKMYFAVLDIKEMINEDDINDFKEAFKSIEELPRPSLNHTYIIGQDDDGNYTLHIFEIPSIAKKLFNANQRKILKHYFAKPVMIGKRLVRTLESVMVIGNITEAMLIIPEQVDLYQDIFDSVIEYTFDEIDRRYDPETGVCMVHVKAKFDKNEIKIRDTIQIQGDKSK